MKASIFEWSIHRKGTHKGGVRVHIKGKKERLHTKEEKGEVLHVLYKEEEEGRQRGEVHTEGGT